VNTPGSCCNPPTTAWCPAMIIERIRSMHARLVLLIASVILILFVGLPQAMAQLPNEGKGQKAKNQDPPTEEKEILKEIDEAYKAPLEVHKDVLKELRRSYEK